MIVTEIKAVTAAGKPIITAPEFSCLDDAFAWAEANADQWPGMTIRRRKTLTFETIHWAHRPRVVQEVAA